ncbi:uncharacterized protein EV420DRAFT_1272717, partial [Desarmillaria tabescens]
FTCGVHMSGHVESENRVNKSIGDIKTTLFDLVTGLIKRTEGQDDMETLHVQQTTQVQHPSAIDVLFAEPLKLIQGNCVLYAVQKSYKQMEHSVFYHNLLNTFEDDNIKLSTKYLLCFIATHGWLCSGLFKIAYYTSESIHFIAVLDMGHTLCDCMMGINLGIPCCHYYALLHYSRLTREQGLSTVVFYLSLFNQRYLSISFNLEHTYL